VNNKKSNFPLPPKPKKNLYVGKWISIIWFCFFGIVFGIAGLFFAVSEGFLGEMPDTAELERVVVQCINRSLAIATSTDRG